MRKVLFLITAITLILTSTAWAADISGTWTFNQKNNEGVDDSFDVVIKANGENLTVAGNHSKIGALSGTGTLKGDAININLNAAGAAGKGSLSFTYKGKVSGNKIAGTKETKMNASSNAQGGQGGGQVPSGGQAPAGGGQGGPSMEQGGTKGGAQGAAAGGAVSNVWTAEKK